MKSIELTMQVPEDVLYTLNETKKEFTRKMKLYAAMELYRLQKLSMGKAAELAGINKVDFLFELGRCDNPVINYDEDDFGEEIARVMNQ
jgi:predicted HTH domain antitoxin